MRLTFTIFIILSISRVFSMDQGDVSIFEQLHGEKNLALTITYPFDSLYKSNNSEIAARISIRTDTGYYLENEPISLTIRGKFRRMKCNMPPLLLNFKKSTLRNLNLSNVDEVKLVTHCMEGAESISNLEEERLLYQMYESVTPLSYKTIWVKVTYCNTLKNECIVTAGFLLEPDKVLSKRLGVVEKKLFNLAEDSIHFESYSNAAAFNFLIGNRDWSIVASRNAKLFFDPSKGKYIVIPYDFDFSNIVGATYRRETLVKEMEHPFDRIYQGEYFKDQAGSILKNFYAFQKTIIEAVQTANNPMDLERRKKICRYLDSWFTMVNRSKPRELNYGMVCPYDGAF